MSLVQIRICLYFLNSKQQAIGNHVSSTNTIIDDRAYSLLSTCGQCNMNRLGLICKKKKNSLNGAGNEFVCCFSNSVHFKNRFSDVRQFVLTFTIHLVNSNMMKHHLHLLKSTPKKIHCFHYSSST